MDGLACEVLDGRGFVLQAKQKIYIYKDGVKSKDGASTDYTPRGFIHPMDCTYMVIGMARGDSARIWDYYTRDRSTPKRDTVWGGSNDLTAAAGWERDGETVIMFRYFNFTKK